MTSYSVQQVAPGGTATTAATVTADGFEAHLNPGGMPSASFFERNAEGAVVLVAFVADVFSVAQAGTITPA